MFSSDNEVLASLSNLTSHRFLAIGSLYDVTLRELPTSTSSSAVAKRPRDASCLSVVSFNSTLRQAQSSIISYTLALDLPLRKLNCVLFSFSSVRRIYWCVAFCAVNRLAP